MLNTIFRAAHSIKGASTTFGIDEVGKFTHVLESLLERLREGELLANAELVELLLNSVDVLYGLVANAKDGVPLPKDLDEVFAALKVANGSEPKEDAESIATHLDEPQAVRASNAVRITLNPSREFFHFGQDPLLLLRELSQLGCISKIVVDDSALPSLAELNPELCYLRWTVELESNVAEQELHDVFMFLDSDSSYEIESIANNVDNSSVVDSVHSTATTQVDARSALAEEKPAPQV